MRWITMSLLLATRAAWAQSPPWVALSTGLPAVAVDTSSSVKMNALQSMALFRIRYAGPMATPSVPPAPPHIEVRFLAQVQCADSTFRTLTMRFYDSVGREVMRVREAGPWQRHPPGDTGYLLTVGWCKLQR